MLLPDWVRRLYVRRSADRPGRSTAGRRSSWTRTAAVRDVFGSYDPYRDGQGLMRSDIEDRDLSYVADVARPRRADRSGLDADRSRYVIRGDDEVDAGTSPDPGDERGHPRRVDGGPPREAGRDDGDDVGDADDMDDVGVDGRPYGDLADVAVLGPRPPRSHPDGDGHGGGTRDDDLRAQRAARARAARERAALRRRRMIFFTLLAGFVASLAAVLVTAAAVAWGVHATAAVLLLGYTNLLVRHHRRLEERTTKVHRLAPAADIASQQPSVVVLSGEGAR